MQAIILNAQGLEVKEDYPVPLPEEGEALVRVVLAGICSTDLELVAGYYPFEGVLGHEFVGVVEQCSSAPDWEQKRVVATINLSPDCDGSCGADRCPEHCPKRRVLGIVGKDGCFAEYLTVPVANLLEVPQGLTDEQAVFTEPLAAACRIPQQVECGGREALIIGPGRLGILCAQVLREAGAKVTLLGRSEASLRLPRDLGFSVCREGECSPASIDLIVEATANPQGLRLAASLVAPGGELVLKSTYAEEERAFEGFAPVLANLVVNEVRVIGSRCGPFDKALELLATGKIETASLIEGEMPLSGAIDAFERAVEPGVRKLLLRI